VQGIREAIDQQEILIGSGIEIDAEGIAHAFFCAPLVFAQNAVEWALEDRGLLELRSRGGQFARTLDPMTAGTQAFWEYSNYLFALIGLAIVFAVHRALRRNSTRRYAEILGIKGV
jgi:ABC-2 type transport system permease protein